MNISVTLDSRLCHAGLSLYILCLVPTATLLITVSVAPVCRLSQGLGLRQIWLLGKPEAGMLYCCCFDYVCCSFLF